MPVHPSVEFASSFFVGLSSACCTFCTYPLSWRLQTHTQTQHTLWLALAECLLKLNHSAMFLHIDADIAVCTCRHCAQVTFKAGVYTLWFKQWCTISLPMLHLCMLFNT